MIQLSWINLALHRNDEALRLARHGADLVPMKVDAVAGPFVLAALAEIEARTGHTPEAIEHLRYLLASPVGQECCIQRLKIDPVWDPIRNDPGFQQLLHKSGTRWPLSMSSDPTSDVKFEIGHVLFIDIVGYSKVTDQRTERATRDSEGNCARNRTIPAR